MTAGRTTRRVVSSFVAPKCQRPLAVPRGTAASPSSVATMTTGTVSSASVSDAHRMPPVPKVGVGSGSEKNSAVDRPADEVDEEADPEDAEDDRGHAGEVVHGDADGADEGALPRVLAQVERGEDSERE